MSFFHKPLRPFTAGRRHKVLAVICLPTRFHTENRSVFVRKNSVRRCLGHNGHIGRKRIAHIGKDDAVHVRTEMADAGRNKHNIRRGGFPFQFMYFLGKLIAVYLSVTTAVPAVHRIHIGN